MKIFYGICGEGLGHSGRSLALIERLVALGHAVTIFTFADAYRLLADSGYQPHRIEGLRWRENKRGGVSTLGTVANLCEFLRARRESLDAIRQLALVERPDLFITDFEPLTSLAAASLKIPCVSVDNQHRFCQPLGRQLSARSSILRSTGGPVRAPLDPSAARVHRRRVSRLPAQPALPPRRRPPTRPDRQA